MTSRHLLSNLPPQQAFLSAFQELLRRKRAQKAALEAKQLAAKLKKGPPTIAQAGSLLYNPQSPFHILLQPALFKILYGGRDSAKSWTVAEYIVRRMCVESILVLCTREYQSSISDSVHRLLVHTIHRLGLGEWFEITTKSIKSLAGAEVIYKGLHHNIAEVKSTEGIDIVWVEEGQNTSNDSLEILIPTIRKDGSEMIVTFNVTDVHAPIHHHFVTEPPPETLSRQVNYDQNPFLSERSRKTIEHKKATDFHAYEHIYLGMPKKFSDSLIYGGRYKVEAFPDDLWRKADRLHQGLDFGFANDPNAFVREFIIGHKLYIEYEAGGVGIEIEDLPAMLTGEIAPDHPDKARAQRVIDEQTGGVPKDHPAPVKAWPLKCDNARPETISFLRGKGFNASAAEKWTGSVEDGIAHVKGHEIIIHPRCKNTAQEARLYSYKRDQKTGEVLPVIVDKNNHYWDGVRYGLDGYIQRRGSIAVWQQLGQ